MPFFFVLCGFGHCSALSPLRHNVRLRLSPAEIAPFTLEGSILLFIGDMFYFYLAPDEVTAKLDDPSDVEASHEIFQLLTAFKSVTSLLVKEAEV